MVNLGQVRVRSLLMCILPLLCCSCLFKGQEYLEGYGIHTPQDMHKTSRIGEANPWNWFYKQSDI